MIIAFAIAAGIITLIAWACCAVGGAADSIFADEISASNAHRGDDHWLQNQPHSGGDKTAFNHGENIT